jgi:hypothetical protein
MANYPGKLLEEVNLLEYQSLENEIKNTVLGTDGIFIRLENKLCVFYQSGDVELFEEILRFKRASPNNNSDHALTHFIQWENSDIIVDILYEQNYQSCITYQIDDKAARNGERRFQFLAELLKKDLILVFEISVFDPKDRFVVVYSSFESNAREAERLQFRFQLTNECIQRHIPALTEAPIDLKSPGFWGKSGSTKVALEFFDHRSDRTSKRSVPFVFRSIADFKGGDISVLGHRRVKEHFFSAENKNQLLHSIVSSCYLNIRYRSSKKTSIVELLDDEVFSGYYALHDDSIHRLTRGMKEAPNTHDTKLFLKMWAEKISLNALPLSEIRSYFGESIGFYFGWLDFYTKWLVYLSVIGICSFLYGCFSLVYQRASAITIFDNESTPIFAFAISIWSLLFLKYWKRKAHYLSFVWDMDNYEIVEQTRIQYFTSAVRKSPITGKQEEYEPALKRRLRKLVAASAMMLAFAFVCAFIAANIAFTAMLVENEYFSSTSGIVASSFFAVLQIFVVSPLYNHLVVLLNQFENYKTKSAYLNNLVWKEFIMSFANSYGILVFNSIINPVTNELDEGALYFGLYQTQCNVENGYNSCLSDLVISIAIIFGLKQFLYQLYQLLYPYLIVLWAGRKSKLKNDSIDMQDSVPFYMKQEKLRPITQDNFSWEYSSKVIQMGYVLLFSAPFPLAPILGWVSNVIEMRLDVWKYLHFFQRPFVQGAKSIGAWGSIIEMMVYLSTLTNGIIIAFTSNGLHNLLFSRISIAEKSVHYTLALKFAFVIVFEVRI